MAQKFQVIVIGGSISGLTFAHCLDRAGIDYVLLEKHKDIEANIGGVITLAPNGTRILGQLGLLDAVTSVSQPIRLAHIGYPDGVAFTHRWPALVASRLGHSYCTLTRQQLLRILYTRLRNKSKVNIGKRVIHIGTASSGVSVSTADGHTYYGDLVVGADGAHSLTRSEMWRIAALNQPELDSIRLRGIVAQYRCAFGTSEAVSEVLPGDQIMKCLDGLTIFLFGASDGLVGWCVVQKLDHIFYYPEIPRYSQAEVIALCESLANVLVRKNLRFREIWERRKFATMTTADEGLLKLWHFGRITCIGDSINKTTPALGQGAALAIESAAALANGLHRLLNIKGRKDPSEAEIIQMLEDIFRTSYLRAKVMCTVCHAGTRILARDGPINKFLGRYVVFLFDPVTVIYLSRLLEAGVRLNYLPSGEVQRRCVLNGNTISIALISLLCLWLAIWLASRAFFA